MGDSFDIGVLCLELSHRHQLSEKQVISFWKEAESTVDYWIAAANAGEKHKIVKMNSVNELLYHLKTDYEFTDDIIDRLLDSASIVYNDIVSRHIIPINMRASVMEECFTAYITDFKEKYSSPRKSNNPEMISTEPDNTWINMHQLSLKLKNNYDSVEQDGVVFLIL